MNVLAGKASYGKTSGSIKINGKTRESTNMANFKKVG